MIWTEPLRKLSSPHGISAVLTDIRRTELKGHGSDIKVSEMDTKDSKKGGKKGVKVKGRDYLEARDFE